VADHNLLTAALAEAQTNITSNTTALTTEVSRATAAEAALGTRTTALESSVGTTFPGASNTGYGTTSLTTIAAGSLTIANNTTISGYDIAGEVIIPANVTGVVIQNCRITGSVNYGVRVNSGSSVTIQDTEIRPTPNTTGSVAIGATTAATGTCLIQRCNIYGYEDGIKPGNGFTIKDNYIHDLGNNTVTIQSIANTTGNTWRYTVSPTVYGEAMPFAVSNSVVISGTTNAANSFTVGAGVAVTAVGSNWFEITNASGVAQSTSAGVAVSSHCDGIQVQNGVSNLLINHNTILSPTIATGVTSAIFVSPDLGPAGAGPVTIMNNYLSGGPYTLIIVDGNNGQYHTSGLSVINNTFVNNSLYGPTRITEPSTYWSAWYGNVFTDKTPVSPGTLTALQQTALNNEITRATAAETTLTTNVTNQLVGINAKSPATGVVTALVNSRSATIQAVGDSTGDEQTEWFGLLGKQVGAAFGANVLWRPWNTTNLNYDYPTTLSSGPSGDRYTTLTAAGLTWAAASITGPIEVIVKVNLTSYASGSVQTLVSKYDATGAFRSWQLSLSASGKLTWIWSADGTTTTSVASTVSVPFSNGTTGWMRVQFQTDNGASGSTANFATSTDGITWTASDTAKVTAGVTSLFNNSTIPYQVGSYQGASASQPANGNYYWVEIRNAATNGVTVVPPMLDDWESATGVATVFTNGSPNLLLSSGHAGGQSISGYFDNSTNRPKLFSESGPDLIILNSAHNDTGWSTSFIATYSTWVTNIKALLSNVPIVCVSQNTRKVGTFPITANQVQQHKARVTALAKWTQAQQGVYFVDTQRAFTDPTTQVRPDGLHPTQEGDAGVPAGGSGSTLWANYLAHALFGL
jgi:hypothetical protein